MLSRYPSKTVFEGNLAFCMLRTHWDPYSNATRHLSLRSCRSFCLLSLLFFFVFVFLLFFFSCYFWLRIFLFSYHGVVLVSSTSYWDEEHFFKYLTVLHVCKMYCDFLSKQHKTHQPVTFNSWGQMEIQNEVYVILEPLCLRSFD